MTLDCKVFIHPHDQKAMDALKAIPCFDGIMKSYLKMFDENILRGINMASKIRLSAEQLPEIYQLLHEICTVVGIKEPELYLEMNPEPNAYTFGDTNPFIVITSGLVDLLRKDELKAAIAHECGHIICHHVLYHSVGITIIKFGSLLGGFSELLTAPFVYAMRYWMRRSELSADRVSAFVMGGCDCVVRTMMRISGGAPHITDKVDIDKYLQQANEYLTALDESTFNKLLQAWAIKDNSHPFPVIRCYEVKKWYDENKSLLPSRL